MADSNSPDYKRLFLQAEQRSKQAKERLKQAEERSKQAEEKSKQAEKKSKQAEERSKQAEEYVRRTTFMEFMRLCHNLLCRQVSVETPSRSTAGTIPPPTGKYCPLRLEPWIDCATRQQDIFNSVCSYLQPAEETRARLFAPLIALEEYARKLNSQPFSCEENVKLYERITVEDHVADIIAELCKIDAARDEFGLGDRIWFESHKNFLDSTDDCKANEDQPSNIHHPRPDQFCIHRVDGKTSAILTTVEYKPLHKLSCAALRLGLRPMDVWHDMVRSNKIPQEDAENVKFKAERLVCSAIVQEYHVMIQEGLEYSYLTNGIARVLLRVPSDDPSTLYYFFCDPDEELKGEIDQDLQEPKTSIARVLCLCLMAFRSPVRGQEWRNFTRSQLPLWETNFDPTDTKIPEAVLRRINAYSDSTDTEYVGPGSSSEYRPSSSPTESPTEGRRMLTRSQIPMVVMPSINGYSDSTCSKNIDAEPSSEYQPSSSPPESPTEGRRMPTRSQGGCAPSGVRCRTQSPDSSGSDANHATRRKRGFSQVASSPSAQRAARQLETGNNQGSQTRRRDAQFCTQRCLRGLQTGGVLDDSCPNVMFHRQSKDDLEHPTTSDGLVRSLKEQLDENIDRCIPFGSCGSYGAPFKLTCAIYGYTVIGKGTTSRLWKDVSREAQVYQVLRKAQASAVPIFLGTIDLVKIYFLHGAGEIRHMLVMGWGGESTATMELTPQLHQEIRRSKKEIEALGITHDDFRYENVLWNEELGRALIIDFHLSTLNCQPTSKRAGTAKRRLCRKESRDGKRLRV
ncbi:hypothetical protein BDV28DRAFT_133535 [Aspergillus coremiiformis]|uniref:Protein kinase domain-containing protein n=1 Tax=Aspergillus coremiiformis TaxID=138285 RepID=A0A5N6Z6A9_9EURO|nr:hypothetical protein BDV28DRAFT_133535 [Aspergillus coremiiformis]